MKVIPIQLLNSTSRALFLTATRTDGQVYGFSTTDEPVEIDGLMYGKGMDISTFVLTSDLGANNGEINFLPDDEVVTISDLLTGVWNNFQYDVFEADWTSPGQINRITAGTSGEVSHKDDKYVVELRGIKQALQNPQGLTTQATCRARFADYPAPLKYNVLCRLDPDDWMVTGEVASSPNRYAVNDPARTEPDDWFGNGYFTALTGDNGGRSRQVKSFVAGLFIFDRPFDYEFFPGDEYEALAGCRKRHEKTSANPDGISDCLDKFDNVLNFQGEPHTPGIDALARGAEQ